jgi:hypothetical protein
MLQASGQISMGDINVELGRARTTQISLNSAESNGYGTLIGTTKPDGVAPNKISEWYSYNHTPTDVTPPSTVVLSQSWVSPTITLTWTIATDASGIDRYDVYQNTDGAGYNLVATRDFDGTRSYSDLLDPDTTNLFKVNSYDIYGNFSVSNIVSRNGPVTCFVKGTTIMLSSGVGFKIEDLVENMTLMSSKIENFEDTNIVESLYQWQYREIIESRIESKINKISSNIVNKTIIINNGLIETTPEHSQLINRDGVWKFIPMGEVIINDSLYDINKNIIKVDSIFINTEARTVYPMSLIGPTYTYFANGILTHNVK